MRVNGDRERDLIPTSHPSSLFVPEAQSTIPGHHKVLVAELPRRIAAEAMLRSEAHSVSRDIVFACHLVYALIPWPSRNLLRSENSSSCSAVDNEVTTVCITEPTLTYWIYISAFDILHAAGMVWLTLIREL